MMGDNMDFITEFFLILIIIFLPLISQGIITSTYNKYSKINNSSNLSGRDVARKILDKNGLYNVSIYEIPGTLSDHYDPKNKSIALSNNIYNETSISSVSVAAHEVGHAIQDKESYSFLTFRTKLVPVVNLTSRFSTVLIVIGFGMQLLNMVYLGILLLGIGLLFQFVTLPVEFDASRRAKKELQDMGLIADKDVEGTKKVLNAAAFTYVAGFISTALNILRLLLISKRRD